MNLVRLAQSWYRNTLNSAIYLFSGGRTTRHEGLYSRLSGTWSNWSRTFRCRPKHYATPTTEAEISELVQGAQRVRVVGAGHTFNDAPLTDGLLLSLDRYAKVLSVDHVTKTVRVQAGIRLRDLTPQIEALGLALPVLGSTNAQSIGGLVASDLHGTGRAHGFLSERIAAMRIVNAQGAAVTVKPGDELFHAAIGGMGCCGVVTEVELRCEDAFPLAKSVEIQPRVWVEENIDALLQEHRHLSFYYIAGANVEHVRVNLWDETKESPRSSSRLREIAGELIDMLFSGYLLGLTPTVKKANMLASAALVLFKATMHGRKTIYPSATGFRRKLYYHHDELEYGVPYEVWKQCLQEILDLLTQEQFVTILEIRFTPDTSQGLLGPGAGRRTCFIELAPSLSGDTTAIFRKAEQILLRYNGQVHLGKANWMTPAIMESMFGNRFERFQEVRRTQDPHGKFANAFTARVFGT